MADKKWRMPNGTVVSVVPSTMPKGLYVATDDAGNDTCLTREDFAKCTEVAAEPKKTTETIVEKTGYVVIGGPMFLWGVAVGTLVATWIFIGGR